MNETSWQSLPGPVLGRLLRLSDHADRAAAFATCKAFTRALLCSSPQPQLTLGVDDFQPALAKVLRWGEECQANFRLRLVRKLPSSVSDLPQFATLQPLVHMLQEEGLSLGNVNSVHCEGLLLDVSGGLAALLPNLQRLEISCCQIDDGVQRPLSGCTQLQHLTLVHRGYSHLPAERTAHDEAWTSQLRTLAALPSFTSLSVDGELEPSLYLSSLPVQLTQLSLSGMDFALPLKDSLLAGLPLLVNLRSLAVSCCNPKQLATWTVLTQLQQLDVSAIEPNSAVIINENGDAVEAETAATSDGSGDLVLSSLLQFPHLTNLQFHGRFLISSQPQHSYADRPCVWKQLILDSATPQALAKLPLHSLAVLQLTTVRLWPDVTVDDIHAAAENLARSPALRLVSGTKRHFTILFDHRTDEESFELEETVSSAAELLTVLAPLVPQDIIEVTVFNCRADTPWNKVDAAVISALRRAVPPMLYKITFNGCHIMDEVWWEMPHSFPDLRKVEILHFAGLDEPMEAPTPTGVCGYYAEALRSHKGPGVPLTADIDILWIGNHDEFEDEEDDNSLWVNSFKDITDELRALGLRTTTVTARYY